MLNFEGKSDVGTYVENSLRLYWSITSRSVVRSKLLKKYSGKRWLLWLKKKLISDRPIANKINKMKKYSY